MSRLPIVLLAALGLFAATLLAQSEPKKPEPGGERRKDPALAPVTDDPRLPRVLLIGDSISIGYTIPVRRRFAGKANVHRIPTNGGPTSNGVKNIDQWVADSGKWDVIHFNFGLHDLKVMDHGKRQVEPDEYEANLRTIVGRLKMTGAKFVWATTTPVPDADQKPVRRAADVALYNERAAKVMTEAGVAVDDLYAFALPKVAEIQRPKNVHFTPSGSAILAEQVAQSIDAALPSK